MGGAGVAGHPAEKGSSQWVHGKAGEPLRLAAPTTPDRARLYFDGLEAAARDGGVPYVGWIAYELGPLADPAMGAAPCEPGSVLAEFAPLSPSGGAWCANLEPGASDGPSSPDLLRRWRASGRDYAWGFCQDTRSQYGAKVALLQAGMAAGDYYEANLTTSFMAPCRRPDGEFIRSLFRVLRPQCGGLLWLKGRVVASLSPELFLRRRGDVLVTRPIKGTSRRGPNAAGDLGLARQLSACPKNDAEHLMVVDLARNDLGRICLPGTVGVVDYKRVETHPALLHLTSTIAGRQQPGTTLWRLLQALWPPASITGCPKVAVTRVLSRLEGAPRRIYTGAFGLVLPNGDLELNVAIRTLEFREERGLWTVRTGSGGAVVADSDPNLEWQECLLKVSPLLGALITEGQIDPLFAGRSLEGVAFSG